MEKLCFPRQKKERKQTIVFLLQKIEKNILNRGKISEKNSENILEK